MSCDYIWEFGVLSGKKCKSTRDKPVIFKLPRTPRTEPSERASFIQEKTFRCE